MYSPPFKGTLYSRNRAFAMANNNSYRRYEMNNEGVKEILYQQLQLLAEKSEESKEDIESLLKLSAEIDRIASTLLRN